MTSPTPTADRLRLGHPLSSLRPTLHNGPGWRIGLWLQGCSLRCTRNCLSPHLLDAGGGFLAPVAEVAAALRDTAAASARPVEGVTVLGGEPTDQAEALASLLESLRADGLSTMVYSGHTLASLRRQANKALERLLATTDLLVDGPFVERLYRDDLAWRGSSNQQIHCLTGRYSPAELERRFERQGKGYSIKVSPRGGISVSGFQTRAAASEVEAIVQGEERP
jgi:anaerobic ribonucleoside-triphosphate reductase activating protein